MPLIASFSRKISSASRLLSARLPPFAAPRTLVLRRIRKSWTLVALVAPYGQPKYKGLILSNLVEVKSDGSFWLDMSYFDYCTGLRMTNYKFSTLFGIPARKSEENLEQIHMDIASSLQAVTEEIMLRLTRSLHKESRICAWQAAWP